MKKYKTNLKRFEIVANETDFPRTKITNSTDAFKTIRQFYNSDIEIYESFFLLMMNRANNTVGYVKISQGGICGTVVDVKIIAKYCIDNLVSGVILCHNHPSGIIKPSENDRTITEKIKQALLFIDTNLLDHLIISTDSFYSFADEGLL